MLARRIKRDIRERGRSVEGILDQFVSSAISSFEAILTDRIDIYASSSRHTITSYFLVPNMPISFVWLIANTFVFIDSTYLQIVPGQNNTVAIDLICTHITRQLQQRSIRFNSIISSTIGPRSPLSPLVDHRALFDNQDLNRLGIHLLKQTPQLKVTSSLFLQQSSMINIYPPVDLYTRF